MRYRPETPDRPPARVLVVGAGQVARDQHLPALRALGDRVTLAGVVDPDADRGRRLAAEAASALGDVPALGEVPAFDHLPGALDAVRPDVVLVTAPPATHVEVVPACLRAGAWVICEKPPARSLAELDVIAAAERETGVPCSFIFQQRFGATARLLHRATSRELLGPVRAATAQTLWFRDEDYYRAPWRGRWAAEGGGVLSSLGVHALDLAVFLAGGWSEVAALAASLGRDIEVDNLSGAVVRLEGGGLLSVLSSALSPRQESRLRLDFDDATIDLVHLYTYANADWTLTVRDGAAPHVAAALRALWARRGPDPATQHTAMIAAVLDARDAGTPPPCSGADGRSSFELVTACYAAALTGRSVRRGEVGAGSPFHSRLDGGRDPWPRPGIAPGTQPGTQPGTRP